MDIVSKRRPAQEANRIEEKGEADLAAQLAIIRRRRWEIIIPVLFCTVLSTVIVVLTTNIYTAVTDLALEARQEKVVNIEAVLTDALPDKETIETELRTILSRSLVRTVIDNLHLDDYSEFNPKLRAPTLIGDAVAWVRSSLPIPSVSEMAGDKEREESLDRARVIDEILDHHLRVVQVPDSRVLEISFSSENPDLAARAANELAAAYITSHLDAKFEATRKANAWLQEKLGELRQNAQTSERSVERFRSQAGLLESEQGVPLIAKQVGDLNSELIAAQAQRVAAEARLRQVRALAQSHGDVAATADVLASPLIANLVEQETQQKRLIAEFAQEYGSRHPQLINAKAALHDLQAKITSEIDKIARSLENEASVARAREASVQNGLKQIEARLAVANNDQVRLRALQREADAQRDLLELFLKRYQETLRNEGSEGQIARVISPADIPEKQSFPPRMLIVAATLVGSTILFSMIALGREQMDRGLRNGEQVEQLIGERLLGLVPRVRIPKAEARAHCLWLKKKPNTQFAESVRSLYTRLMLVEEQRGPRTVLVTSAMPREGKSSLTSCLAMHRAIAGQRVLMVDADVHRPSLHDIADVNREPGLIDVLSRGMHVTELARPLQQPNLFLLPAGRPVSDVSNFMRPDRLHRFFGEIKASYDIAIINSPPLFAFSDTLLIVPFVDAHVLAVRWGRTHRDVVRLAARQLRETGIDISGIVLTMVDTRKRAQHGFAESAYYTSAIKRYYAA